MNSFIMSDSVKQWMKSNSNKLYSLLYGNIYGFMLNHNIGSLITCIKVVLEAYHRTLKPYFIGQSLFMEQVRLTVYR